MKRVVATIVVAAVALEAPEAALAHGDHVPISRLAGAWHPDPLPLALAALALALFVQALIRLRRRGRAEYAGWGRTPLFVGGLALATLPLVSPLGAVSDEYLLSGHMLEHVLVGDAAPALVVVAVRGPLVFFLLPPAVLRPLIRLPALRRLVGALLRPRVALIAWAAVIAAWHVPAAYDYTLTHETIHALEHACFLVVGTLVWAQLVDPARRGRLSLGRRIGYAALLFGFGQALSDVLVFSFRPLYPTYAAQDERLLGLSPLLDQQLAGVVMMLEQAVTLGICVALLLRAYRRREAQRSRAGLAGVA